MTEKQPSDPLDQFFDQLLESGRKDQAVNQTNKERFMEIARKIGEYEKRIMALQAAIDLPSSQVIKALEALKSKPLSQSPLCILYLGPTKERSVAIEPATLLCTTIVDAVLQEISRLEDEIKMILPTDRNGTI